jgi:hypothetical protein
LSDSTLNHNTQNYKYYEKKSLSELFIREMTYRNYSPRTIDNYVIQLKKLHDYFKISLEELTDEQFKA